MIHYEFFIILTFFSLATKEKPRGQTMKLAANHQNALTLK